MKPVYIGLIVLAVVVAAIAAAIVIAIVYDFKGESIAAKREAKAAKKEAQRKAAQKAKNRAMYSTKPVVVKREEEQPAPAPEAIPEPAPVEEVRPAEVPVAPHNSSEDEEELTQIKAVTENGQTRYIVIKYTKSYLAKLIQSDAETKDYYSFLKNFLLSFKGVKSRLSWKRESFHHGRVVLARLRMRGKTLALELPLNPAEYAESKYHVEDISHIKSCADLPCMYRIKNVRRAKYATELITRVMWLNGVVADDNAQSVNYAKQYPYETTEALLNRKLIKELTSEDAQSGEVFKPRKSVTVAEADTLIKDEVAVELVQKAEPSFAAVTDRTKVDIVNIDTLSKYFKDGETVTLEEIKKRIPEVNKRTTYIKVLARGTLDKSLTVYADNFSLQAVKMIVLTGGKAVKI